MATWYAAEGASGGDGTTAATAWTMAELNTNFAGSVSAGDTVYIIGTHSTKLTVGAAGSAGSPITIRGDYNATDSSYSAGVIDMGAADECILISSKNYITVQNIALAGSGDANGTLINITSTNCIVDNVTITTPVDDGIYFTGACGDSIIRNCTITTTAASSRGIHVQGASTTPISIYNNIITFSGGTDTDHKGIHVRNGQDAVSVYENTVTGFLECINCDDVDNTKIFNNSLSSFTDGTVSRCIAIEGTSGNCEIYGNTCLGGSIAILDDSEALAPGPNSYFGNLVKNYYTNGIDYRSDDTGYAYICNNTVVNDPSDTAGHGIVIQLQAGATANAYIYGNTIECIGDGTNINGIQIASASCNDVTAGYNIMYRVGTGQCYGFDGSDLGTDTVAEWNSTLTTDAATTYAGGDVITTTAPYDSAYNLTSSSDALGAGYKWWTGVNPTGANGEPFSDYQTDAGGIQSTHYALHPANQ